MGNKKCGFQANRKVCAIANNICIYIFSKQQKCLMFLLTLSVFMAFLFLRRKGTLWLSNELQSKFWSLSKTK